MSKDIFQQLTDIIKKQDEIIKSISEKVVKLEDVIGKGNSAIILDYESGSLYERNTLVVDTESETVYRVIKQYTSIDVRTDCSEGNLKLVGFESQVIEFDHDPTQEEIEVIPNESFVAVYNPLDPPYIPNPKE